MRTYNKYRIHSFKCKSNIEKEVRIDRMYIRNNKIYNDTVYAEKTDVGNILIIPDSIIKDLKYNAPYGYTGVLKDGSYRIENKRVTFEDIHSVYNGEGYAIVKEITNGIDEVALKLFNITKDKLDVAKRKGQIDPGMYEPCKHFCDLGFKTVMCCNGHERRKANIKFSTEIDTEALEELLRDQHFIEVKHTIHNFGNFEYVEIQFEFKQENIYKILSLGE